MSRPGSGPRALALAVIRRVVEQGAYSNLALRTALERSTLPPADRALATELTYGTLRRAIPLDHELARLVDRPLPSARPSSLALLRLGAYQLRSTRVPAHAAVAETVALADPQERGFVNAVLRRMASTDPPRVEGDDDEAVSLRTGLSSWAVRELRRRVGDRAEAAAAALAQRTPLTLRTNPCRTTVEDLARELGSAGISVRPGRLFEGSLLVDEPTRSPSELPGYRDGWFTVQDEASTFVAAAVEAEPGDRVLDVCSGPGGKATYLACAVGEHGRLVAADVQATRVGLVGRTLARLGLTACLLVQDGRRPALAQGFDRILVDAPCSGIGSARRRPELLWRPQRSGLSALARLQVGIATASARLLRPGGRLVYAVCTFPRAETDAVCDALLRRAPFLRPAAVRGPDGSAERVRLWPHVHGTDAMFVAAFTRS